MSVDTLPRPSSLFGSEFDPDDAGDFYDTLNERSGRKSRLSFQEDFVSEEAPFFETKYKSFIKKDSTCLKSLNGNIFSFDTEKNIFYQYYENLNMDISALWYLLKGCKIKSQVVHNTRDFLDELPCRFSLTEKHQLDKVLINDNKYTPKPEQYHQNIPDYYEWIKNFCEKNCEVFPYQFGEQIVFIPIISPLWFVNGNRLFKSVENYGYINPNSEYCVGWFSDWLSKYNSSIKDKYIKANKLFQEHKSFLKPEETTDYKEKMISSALTLIQQIKFKNRYKEDSSFRKIYKKYLQKVIKFSEFVNDANLLDFKTFSKIINEYIEIMEIEVIY